MIDCATSQVLKSAAVTLDPSQGSVLTYNTVLSSHLQDRRQTAHKTNAHERRSKMAIREWFCLLSLFIYFLFKQKPCGVGRDNKHSLFVAEEAAIIKCLESCFAYCACRVMRPFTDAAAPNP